MGPQILVSAGEVSGDRMAAQVVQRLGQALPGARFFGAGGAALRAQGVELRHDADQLAVTGLTEALGRAAGAGRMLADLWWQARRRGPALGLLVDYPGINLRLAAALHGMGVPVLYYGAPQRWAWLGFRAARLAQVVDRLAVTLPFEEAWFRQRGINARHVGHPAVEQFRRLPSSRARAQLGLAPGQRALALLPGSRVSEVTRHLPLLLGALHHLGRQRVTLRPLLVTPPGSAGQLCRELAPGLTTATAAQALGAADVALCASGSATIELALAGVPAAVFYRVSSLTHAVARRLIQVPHLALPNLILGRRLLPELIQHQMTPRRLAHQTLRLLDPAVSEPIRRGLAQVVQRLGGPGAADKVAQMALELLSY